MRSGRLRGWRLGVVLVMACLASGIPAKVQAQGGDKAMPVAVPFDFSRHEVLIEATINGQGPFPALLDTGTNPSVIDLSLARQLRLALTPTGRGGDGGGTQKNVTYSTVLPVVGIGGLSVKNVAAAALDLSALSRRFGRPVRAVLGDSLLSGHVVQFDYPARVVRFLPGPLPASAAPGKRPDRVTLPFHHEDCVQVDGVTVNGGWVRANIDTGSNNTFQLTPDAVRTLGLTAQVRRARPRSAAGFNGGYQSRIGTVDRITVGTISVPHSEVTFWMPGTGHDRAAWGLNVGNLFLQHYVVTFDYVRKRLTLDKPLSTMQIVRP